MPQIKPLSEFNRNQNALIEDLSHSGEPLYLTRNGSACVVVMTRPPRCRHGLPQRDLRAGNAHLPRHAQRHPGNAGGQASRRPGRMDELRALRGWE